MAGKYGTKETQEVMSLGAKVAAFMIKEIKTKGLHLKEDVLLFLNSPEFQKAALDAVADASLVPDELGEVDFLDGFALSKHAVVCGMELLEAARS